MTHPLLAQLPDHQGSENAGAAARWLAAMRAGAFAAAWDISDAVLAGRDPALRDDPALPYHRRWVWDGRPLAGRRVLVRCYHGLGDTLQFCRYLAPLRAVAAHVTLEAQAPLVPLLRALPGPDRVLAFDPDRPAAPSDCDIEIMELAHALRLAPDGRPYLTARPLPRPTTGILAGLCWRSGSWSAGRSMPLASLAPLGRVPGMQLMALQRGPGLEEQGGPGTPPLQPFWPPTLDVLATARQMATVDAIVTVDTMVAHLAGALGRPTWLMLQADADWRWMSGRRNSPWYGSIRLFRQREAGDWTGVVAEIASELATMPHPGNPVASASL